MEDNKNIKFLIAILISLLFVISISFALYNFVLKGNKENRITTAKVSFSYKEPNVSLDLTSYNGISDIEGKNLSNYYEFQVKGEASKEDTINYLIYLLELNNNNLSNDNIKVYLTIVVNNIEQSILEPTLISNLNSVGSINNSKQLYQNSFIFDGVNIDEQIHTFRLRIWLKDDFDFNNYIEINEKNYTLEEMIYQFKLNVKSY